MRTVTFKSVCDTALQRYGTDPASLEEQDAVLLALGTAIAQCVEEGWVWTDWPELMTVREVEPDADGRIAMTGDLWRVYGLYQKNPNEYPDAPRVDFADLGDRVQIIGGRRPTSVWVKAWKPPGGFSRAKYDDTTDYVAGDVCYDPATGQCYRALAATKGDVPSTTPEKWELQEFPYVLRIWGALNGAALLHEDDGQFEKGNAKKADALDALIAEQANFKTRTHAQN